MTIDLLKPNMSQLEEKWGKIVDSTYRIWTWDTRNEKLWICEYASRCSVYLELGGFVGASSKLAFLSNPELTLCVIDTWDDEGTSDEYSFNLRNYRGQFRQFQGTTESWLEANKKNGKISKEFGEFDGCWIDAGHERHLARYDALTVKSLLKKGALMAGHDFHGNNDVAEGVYDVFPRDKVYNPVDSVWCAYNE